MNHWNTSVATAVLACLMTAPVMGEDAVKRPLPPATQTQEQTQDVLKKAPDGTAPDKSAKELAPGQMQKSGEADNAAEAAPGQMQKKNEATTATDVAPGQVKKTDQAEQKPDQPSSETTSSINITTEQKTEPKKALAITDVKRVDVDIDISVGVAVPSTVKLYRLPPRLVTIVPAYEDYEYFVLSDGRIVIVEPSTLKIVLVLT